MNVISPSLSLLGAGKVSSATTLPCDYTQDDVTNYTQHIDSVYVTILGWLSDAEKIPKVQGEPCFASSEVLPDGTTKISMVSRSYFMKSYVPADLENLISDLNPTERKLYNMLFNESIKLGERFSNLPKTVCLIENITDVRQSQILRTAAYVVTDQVLYPED